MTDAAAEQFIDRLVSRHAGLKPLYEDHIKDNDELLSHVFFGDITRWYEKLCAEGRTAEAQRLVADIDAALAAADEDDYVDNLIHVSFLENLDHEREGVAWSLLSDRLKVGFDMIHGYS